MARAVMVPPGLVFAACWCDCIAVIPATTRIAGAGRMAVESLDRSERDLIQRRKLHEEVALRIEEMIHSGRYAVGAQLPSERELTERFGVGRPSVREALL